MIQTPPVEGERKAECPNCGGPIAWRLGASAAQVCPFCSFTVVRTDRDLSVIGKVADLVPTAAPITVGDHGKIGETGFQVAGRLQLDHGKGPWDEWYVGLDGGRWAWLARAQGHWYLTFPVQTSGLPTWEQMAPGNSGKLTGGGDHEWTAVERGESQMVSAEGELPYPTRPGEQGRYVDLQAAGGGFATIDYGDGTEAPHFYVGQQYEADQITWTEAAMGPRPTEKVAVDKLRCPTCGGPVPIMVPDKTERAACPACNSLLDFSQGALSFLSQLNQQPLTPYIPLGTRGTLLGEEVMCIGFMERATIVEGVTYAWREYLLHADGGYRWILEDSGNFTVVQAANPADVRVDGSGTQYGGKTYRLYSTAFVFVRYVVGEFYWQVNVGDRSDATDYIAPPFVLSEERTAKEVNWSAGKYLPGEEIWKAFSLPGSPPSPTDVAPGQPNPVSLKFPMVFSAVAIALLAAVFFLTQRPVPTEVLFDGPLTMPAIAEQSMVTRGNATATTIATTGAIVSSSGPTVNVSYSPTFTVPEDAATLRVAITSNMGNGWIGIACALVNEGTGTTTEFLLEQDLFHGAGPDVYAAGNSAAVEVGNLTPGQYSLRMDPRWARKASTAGTAPPTANIRVSTYDAAGNANQSCCCVAGFMLILPLPFAFVRRRLFEGRRWRNSNIG
ncbi:MAG: hypothetical protein DRJ42_03915 [Deltaproteobacteria bacterium]|nr:MAG: hypothetical protein DRJ42_03915 [Deltaproteobacteria bacterium]